jgi:acetolactate synthase-1/2/3 large subunit
MNEATVATAGDASRHRTQRIGGNLVAETLQALGAEVAFGVPGVHALAIWEGLRDTPIRVIGTRTELCAGFAADGYARSSGRPGVVLLSTGPGAMNSLTAVMEAASSHVPLVLISSQIPSELIGRGRGYLHELPDQLGAFGTLVKSAERARSPESIPGVLARAFERALAAPSGPVFVEIAVDLLTGPAGDAAVDVDPVAVERRIAPAAAVLAAASLLVDARSPVLWAGGGVIRSDARPQLRALAELLGAPVATTYMGKGAIADDHPLAVGAGCDEAAFQQLLSEADVVLCVGTELGAETTGQYKLRFGGRVIHLDADADRIGVTYNALAVVGDARATLAALIEQLRGAGVGVGAGVGSDGSGRAGRSAERVAAIRKRIAAGLDSQGRALELGVLSTVHDALSADAIGCWDMTILGYWAAPHLRIGERQQFLYPLGSGTLGYGWPAALGASVAHPDRQVLGVVGDGGFQYAVAELGTAAQHGIDAKLLIVDDGGYGILREYQRDAFGETTAVELPGKDLAAIAAAYGVPVRLATPDDLGEQLAWAFAQDGPAVVVLRSLLAAAAPTP